MLFDDNEHIQIGLLFIPLQPEKQKRGVFNEYYQRRNRRINCHYKH